MLVPAKNADALTAIGGGIVRVALSGPGWRRLLMEGGVFDAESQPFGPGCGATSIIDHANVRLHCYVPTSYAHDLVTFWQLAAFSSD